MIKTILLLTLTALMGCEIGTGYKVYTIKTGEHYSNNRIPTEVTDNELEFMVIFDSSAIYTTKNPTNQSDINKLYGFNEGISDDNSCRIGWNYKDGNIYLYPYFHIDGKNLGSLDPVPFAIAQIGKEIHLKVGKDDKFYYVEEVGGQKIQVPRVKGGKPVYLSYPYFGGDETAPHDIKIRIKTL